jgi:hypothetical protein
MQTRIFTDELPACAFEERKGKLASINERKSGDEMPHPTMDLSCLQRDPASTKVTLTVWFATAILLEVSSKSDKSGNSKRIRAPRIRVPNSERAIFSVDESKFLGVIQRLSLTGGSAVLAKGPIPRGTMGKLILNTVYGRVTAEVEFLQTGADGIPLAQAFRFIAMDDDSSRGLERCTAENKPSFRESAARPIA